MSPRRALAAAASGVLLVLLLARESPRQLRLRALTLMRSSETELAVRRLHGTGASFDRNFFAFLESVRRALPGRAPGIAVLGKPVSDPVLFEASYVLAPVPVLVAPERIPEGWLVAVYGTERPPGWKTVAPVWKGVLLAPGS